MTRLLRGRETMRDLEFAQGSGVLVHTTQLPMNSVSFKSIALELVTSIQHAV